MSNHRQTQSERADVLAWRIACELGRYEEEQHTDVGTACELLDEAQQLLAEIGTPTPAGPACGDCESTDVEVSHGPDGFGDILFCAVCLATTYVESGGVVTAAMRRTFDARLAAQTDGGLS